MATTAPIPIILLKTRSQPDDIYEEYFTSPDTIPCFKPVFMPVLEHNQNSGALNKLGDLLKADTLKDMYGGIIFTSQRAVEGWADTVKKVEYECQKDVDNDSNFGGLSDSKIDPSSILPHESTIDTRTNQPFRTEIQTETEFPLYTVGPATSGALNSLINALSSSLNSVHQSPLSRFLKLRPTVLGAHTGNGANLAEFILRHYNALHGHRWFTHYEAPRLPFIPLVGMGSENYSRKRLEASDQRLAKKPLLFLVGEQRRDIIPTTLMNYEKLGKDAVIEVEEVEVYATTVRNSFRNDFDELIQRSFSHTDFHQVTNTDIDPEKKPTDAERASQVIVIVIFSPQGTLDMLKSIGYLDDEGQPTHLATRRWDGIKRNTNKITTSLYHNIDNDNDNDNTNTAPEVKHMIKLPNNQPFYIITTIGPTTRDFLRDEFGLDPDVCATKPSPKGVWDGVLEFLKANHLLNR